MQGCKGGKIGLLGMGQKIGFALDIALGDFKEDGFSREKVYP